MSSSSPFVVSPRSANQLAIPEAWHALRETALRREVDGDWRITLLLAMPDHWHGLCAFPSKPMRKVIGDLKSWLARSHGIRWQQDFFDHRLRSWESAAEKRRYILNNPLRAGLIENGEAWPSVLDQLAEPGREVPRTP